MNARSLGLAVVAMFFCFGVSAQPAGSSAVSSPQQAEPWTPGQLMAPADLAARIKAGNQPLIICVGPGGLIEGSVEAGAAHEQTNLDKLKAILDKQDPGKEVVIYCGCCPFAHCPNVRPAFNLLASMHFTHAYLLNLSHNIRIDWIEHGYPTNPAR